MEHTKHIWRAILIFLSLAIAAIVLRHFLIPESFGEEGFYRRNSRDEFMSKPLVHGIPLSCKPCHGEQFDTRAEGKHATVSCEACHAPLHALLPLEAPVAEHVTDGEWSAEMNIDRSHTLCAYCHQELSARPEDMPQVNLMEHLLSLEVIAPGEQIDEGTCIVCHDSHDPAI